MTNRAVIDAVMSLSPTTVLDLECGEGWLSRELSALGVDVTGVDVVPELIAYAQARGGGDYHVMEYNDVAPEKFSGMQWCVIFHCWERLRLNDCCRVFLYC